MFLIDRSVMFRLIKTEKKSINWKPIKKFRINHKSREIFACCEIFNFVGFIVQFNNLCAINTFLWWLYRNEVRVKENKFNNYVKVLMKIR